MNSQPPTTGEVAQPLADGRYRLVGVLGAGGMAVVYRGYDERLQVYRAIKVLKPELARHDSLRRRFEAEARTMARLHHPHIVGVHDVGNDGARSYIVMELCEGGSLMDRLKSTGPFGPRAAVKQVQALLAALDEAHGQGVIHRDIKPHNVLLARDGKPKVTDFGIARVGDDDRQMTKTGSVMGTWGFMAPEQRTNARGVDARADIYAVGATLYTLLTGRMPNDLFAAELDDQMLDGVEEALREVICKATRYKPADRYGSCMEMHADLDLVVHLLPMEAARLVPLPAPSVPAQAATMVPDVEPDPSRNAPTFADEPFLPNDGRSAVGQDTGPPEDHTDWTPEPRSRRGWWLGGLLGALVIGAAAWVTLTAPGPAPTEAPPVGAAANLVADLPPGPDLNAPGPAADQRAAVPGPDTPDDAALPGPDVTNTEPPPPPPQVKPQKVEKAKKPPQPDVRQQDGLTGGEDPPVPTPPPPPKPARITVTGDALQVTFVGAAGTFQPGQDLPAGTYSLRGTFDSSPPVTQMSVTVGAGERATIRCDSTFNLCRKQ